MKMQNIILKLRIVAFLLFVIPVISLIGSLTFHNFLVGFNYTPGLNLDTYFKNYSPGENLKFLCDEKNDYCRLQGAELEGFERLEGVANTKSKLPG